MKDSVQELLRPERRQDETFDTYKQRRTICALWLNRVLRGRLAFDSTRPRLAEPKSLTNKGRTYKKEKR